MMDEESASLRVGRGFWSAGEAFRKKNGSLSHLIRSFLEVYHPNTYTTTLPQ
jgi:hypothetical protein